MKVVNGVKFVAAFARENMPSSGWGDGQTVPFGDEMMGVFIAHPDYPPHKYNFHTLRFEPIKPMESPPIPGRNDG